MHIRLYENSKARYEVSYWLSTNCPSSRYREKTVKQLNKKVFNNKEAALKYIEGRKAYFSKHYFNELYPPIPNKYAYCYMSSGKLSKGYRLEDEAEEE